MDPGSDFNFQNLPNYKFPFLENAEVKEAIAKWSMSNGLMIQAYSFDKPFRKYNERDFVLDFFGCPNVVSTLKHATNQDTFASIGIPAETVKFSEVKCTLTNLQLFDKLKDGNKIVRSNGAIVKCMPIYVSGGGIHENNHTFDVEIADNLRKFVFAEATEIDDDLLDEQLDAVFTETERKEFLFLLFSHLVIGGSLCQYEETVESYLEVTKNLYKDLIAVARVEKNEDEKRCDELIVISHVYKIHSLANDCGAASGKQNLLFHREYLNNFFYIMVNPLKQLCFTMYHHV